MSTPLFQFFSRGEELCPKPESHENSSTFPHRRRIIFAFLDEFVNNSKVLLVGGMVAIDLVNGKTWRPQLRGHIKESLTVEL